MLKETIKNNKLFLILPIVVLFTTFSLMATSIFSGLTTNTPTAIENGVFTTWCKTVERADGSIEDIGCNHNVVFTDGLNASVDSLVGLLTAVNFSTIVLCNSHPPTSNSSCVTPTAGQTESFRIHNETGLTPKNATTIYNLISTSSNRSMYTTFTASYTTKMNGSRLVDTKFIRNISGDEFATVTLNNQDKITINITFTVV